MKKLLIIIISVIPGLIITCLIAIMMVWTWPEKFLIEPNIKNILSYTPYGEKIKWSSYNFQVKNLGYLGRRGALDIEGFCFDDEVQKVCFEELSLLAELKLSFFDYHLDIKTLQLSGLLANLPSKEKKKEFNFKNLSLPDKESIPYLVELPEIGDLFVEGTIIQGQSRTSFTAKARKSQTLMKVRADIKMDKNKNINLSLQSKNKTEFYPLLLDFSFKNTQITLDLAGEINQNEKTPFVYKGLYTLDSPNIGILKGHSTITYKEILNINFSLDHSQGKQDDPLPPFELQTCQMNITDRTSLSGDLDCSFQIFGLGQTKLKDFSKKWPQALKGDFTSELILPGDEKDGKIEVIFNTAVKNLATTKINLASSWVQESKAQGIPIKFLDIQAGADISIMDLKDFMDFFNHPLFDLPAPLNAMNGPVIVQLDKNSFSYSAKEDLIKSKILASTDLHSKNQVLQSKITGGVEIYRILKENRQINLDFDVLLKKSSLVLPTVALKKPPRLAPDKRIALNESELKKMVEKAEEEEKVRRKELVKHSPVRFSININTDKNRPFLLKSNHLKKPAPIHLDLFVTNRGPAPVLGKINVDPVTLIFFKRDAKLQNLVLDLKPKTDESPVKGTLSIRYTDYHIKVRILGTLGDPQFIFESDPPLSDTDIVSVLVFGKPTGDLGESEEDSAQNLNAAINDGAVTLASMYLFASTPIESISYDSLTSTYRAKVSLDQKTSFVVGTDWEGEQIYGLKRKVGKNLFLRTELRTREDEEASSTTTLLEWSKRY